MSDTVATAPNVSRTRPVSAPLTFGPHAVAVAYGVVAAVAIGAALVMGLSRVAVVLLAVGYVALAQLDMTLAVALWVPLLFAEAHPLFNQGAKAAGVVLLVVWTLRWREHARQSLVHHFALVALLWGLLSWWTLSATWAVYPGVAARDLWHWYALALIYVIMATIATTRRALVLIVGGFVLGAVASVGRGIVGTGRLAGAAGDPNYLGAWLLAGLVLSLALGRVVERRALRAALMVADAVLAYGLVRTVSRGAFVAAVVTGVLALACARGRRVKLAGVVFGFGIAAAIWLSQTPSAWQRITTPDRGDGRYDLWSVAWAVSKSHLVAGAGLNNFVSIEGHYVQQVPPLRFLTLVTTHPHVVHNLYLQLMADVGVVGLLLFVGFAVGSLAAAVRAAHALDAAGDHKFATLAYGVFLAGSSMLVAGFFLSSAVDKRLWCVLALGPALLAVAREGAST